MMIFQLLKKLLGKIQQLIAAYFHRLEKNGDNVRGYALGGPRQARRLAAVFTLFVIGLLVATVMIKRGVFTSVESVIDRETAPGTKLPTDVSGSFDRNDLYRFELNNAQNETGVDCDLILKNLKLRGILTQKEKIDFDRACRDKLGDGVSSIVDKIVAGEIPSSVVADVLDTVTNQNAADVLRALDSDDVRNALRGDSKDLIARNLSDLGRLSSGDLKKAVAAVTNAPPQFREDVIDSVKSIAKLESPEARASLLNTLGAARSKDEVKGIRDFADTLGSATGDEQKILARAFEKAPDMDARRALQRAAREIVQIPRDDPVRGKLVTAIKDISELPPEKQKDAYNKIADVANLYRTTDDPDLKSALASAILAGENPDDILALADRLDNMKAVDSKIPLEKELKLAAITGADREVLDKLSAAAVLANEGKNEEATRALSGDIPAKDLAGIIKMREQRKNDPFKEADRPEDRDISKFKLDSLIVERDSLRKEKKKLENQVSNYLRAGIPLSDVKLLGTMKELAKVDDLISTLDTTISDVRARLISRINDLRKRTEADYAAAGVAIPDYKIEIPSEVLADNTPSERLTDLVNTREFWDYEGAKDISKSKKYFSFNTPEGSNKSLLESARGPGETTWYVSGPAAGTSGSNAGAAEFEMSRTLVVPGIVRRIPEECIPSNKAGTYTLLFEFLTSVANRKTGRMEIPAGSVAICKVKDFDNDSGRLNAQCSAVDVGGSTDLKVNLALGDADGADGLLGIVKDNRGWQLAGVFLTAFSAAILDGISFQFVRPIEQKAERQAQDFLVVGTSGGASNILRDVAQRQIERWSRASTWWCSYNGALASVKQQ